MIAIFYFLNLFLLIYNENYQILAAFVIFLSAFKIALK